MMTRLQKALKHLTKALTELEELKNAHKVLLERNDELEEQNHIKTQCLRMLEMDYRNLKNDFFTMKRKYESMSDPNAANHNSTNNADNEKNNANNDENKESIIQEGAAIHTKKKRKRRKRRGRKRKRNRQKNQQASLQMSENSPSIDYNIQQSPPPKKLKISQSADI